MLWNDAEHRKRIEQRVVGFRHMDLDCGIIDHDGFGNGRQVGFGIRRDLRFIDGEGDIGSG